MPNIVLKVGSQGPAVAKLQQYLNQLGVQVAVDGVFGMGTRTAVLAVQQRLKVPSDGVVGPATWLAISSALQQSLNVSPAEEAATRNPAGVVPPTQAPGSASDSSLPAAPSPAPGGLAAWFGGLTAPMKWGLALLAAGGVWALLPDRSASKGLGRYRRK